MNKDTNKVYTVSFITLGCKVNQFETEAMTEILEGDGFKVLPPNEASDIYIINTCAVTKESERKSRQFINKAKRINPCGSGLQRTIKFRKNKKRNPSGHNYWDKT